MPRGAMPGERRGGRKKGKLNKATLERAALAERIMAEQKGKPGRKLGKELLEDFAVMFAGLAASFQPAPIRAASAGQPQPPLTSEDMEAWAKSYKEPLFEKYAKLAAKCANDFADFQSPRLSRVQTPMPAPDAHGPTRTRFTLSIFDHQGRPVPRSIDVSSQRDTKTPQ
jgi:hypothetical protein